MLIFFVQVCACLEGWMVENEEFCDILVHYQYAEYDQYEPSMHRNAPCCTKHQTLLSQATYIMASSEPRSAQCMKHEYILAVQAPHQVAACVAEFRKPSQVEHRNRHSHFSDHSVCSIQKCTSLLYITSQIKLTMWLNFILM